MAGAVQAETARARERRSKLVGLTGGIGTGKSRVADLLRSLGAVVECSDLIVRELQAPGGAALDEIAATFGREVLLPDGTLDRAKLGQRVFRDPGARARLNRIVHPLVYREFERRVAGHRSRGAAVIVVDIPLLLEGKKSGTGSGAKLPFDVIVLVYASPDTQVARVMARDGLSREDALARIRAQMPIEEKRRMSDVVIENDGDWAATERHVRELYAGWLADP
jgi:dephospho-CoA kinase